MQTKARPKSIKAVAQSPSKAGATGGKFASSSKQENEPRDSPSQSDETAPAESTSLHFSIAMKNGRLVVEHFQQTTSGEEFALRQTVTFGDQKIIQREDVLAKRRLDLHQVIKSVFTKASESQAA